MVLDTIDVYGVITYGCMHLLCCLDGGFINDSVRLERDLEAFIQQAGGQLGALDG